MSPPEHPDPQPFPSPCGPKQVAIGLAIVAVAAIVSGAAVVILLPSRNATGAGDLLATFLLQITMVGAAFGLGPLRSGGNAELLGLGAISRRKALGWGMLALLASLGATLVYGNLMAWLAPSLVPPPLPPELLTESLRIPTLVSVVITAPFAEELFFRGFVFGGLVGRFGVKGGAALSAGAFAAAHPSLALVVPVSISGAIFAIVYWRTRTLWPAILAHMMQNALAFTIAL